ncbi:NAD(P)-dependent oxidoreductase [Glaciibacter flavus]|nr:NAD(P)-dependent oxidoreductase [Glaciibacter flavus]
MRELAPGLRVLPTITASALSASNVDLAWGSRCVSVGHKTPVKNADLLALHRMGVAYLSTRSIGYDHIDVSYANSLGITVENVAYSPDSVADYALMLMLMLVRRATSMLRRTDAHDFRLPELRGKELRDLTVGVVGTGRIGAAVIERLRGFGSPVIACDSGRKIPAEYIPLDELLQRSDIVTLHAPLNADTRHLLNAERLGRMKTGAFVVNTARGALIDTAALLAALESGRLGGAGLDVVEGEDAIFYADHRGRQLADRALLRLQRHPNVVISPHSAYYTDQALRDTVVNGLINCSNFESESSRG